ncbi:unnamed protein product [Zymoseptoria tritici ST99CH_3D7]|uniref:Uncharacterized protein n=2 Tax=Zymoseptoria tritici TaxID=1047171 RepID=A0A1X7S0H7_ZYMT9|nr:unnamed protein product [Zymoseptoria tritici ST99CH_3D7]SMR56777.1 unnamed protein product [Zymoseptoria tritici ST99CH_1E4]
MKPYTLAFALFSAGPALVFPAADPARAAVSRTSARQKISEQTTFVARDWGQNDRYTVTCGSGGCHWGLCDHHSNCVKNV